MLVLLLLAFVWLGVSAGATLVMCGVCRAGRVEDDARGYAMIPGPRQAADDLVTV